MADYLMYASDTMIYGLFICMAVALLIYEADKHDLYISFVIRKKNSVSIYMEQCFDAILLSAVVTVYQILSVAMWSYILCGRMINWNGMSSMYYLATKTVTSLSFCSFIWRCALAIFISTFIISMIVIIADWCRKKWAGFLIILLMAAMDRRGIHLAFSGIIPWYNNIENMPGLLKRYVLGIVAIIGIFVLGICITKRKEYLSGS